MLLSKMDSGACTIKVRLSEVKVFSYRKLTRLQNFGETGVFTLQVLNAQFFFVVHQQ